LLTITTLGYALLGLIRAEPRTGYALRMVFETTPMGSYSSSPGSIYPALKSLE
jgi:DNA-binding PadR family transcriptional regulator